MPSADELFLAVIDDHRRHPRNRRTLPAANRTARRDNPSCGDICTVQLRLDPEGRIAEAARASAPRF